MTEKDVARIEDLIQKMTALSLSVGSGPIEEKKETLHNFLSGSINRLEKLAQTTKHILFLGYVFEELVRCQPKYYCETGLEKELENFLLSCLENKRKLLAPWLWHIPDALGFSVLHGKMLIRSIIEVKTHPKIIDFEQLEGHLRDIQTLVDQITARPKEELPDFLRNWTLSFSRRLVKTVVVPKGSEISDELHDGLVRLGWEIEESIFCIDEAILIAKELFPEALTFWLKYRNSAIDVEFVPLKKPDGDIVKIENEITVGIANDLFDQAELRLEGLLNHFVAVLRGIFSSAVKNDIDKHDLLAAALIWICTDKIFVNPTMASKIIRPEDLIIGRGMGDVELSPRFQKLLHRINTCYLSPANSEKLVKHISGLFEKKIKPALNDLDPRCFAEQSVFDFI